MTDYTFNTDKESMETVINSLSKNPNLNSWEKGFIKSIKEYYNGGGFLSDNQMQKLSELWEKY